MINEGVIVIDGKIEFGRIGYNEETYQECLKMLNKELAPVMSECMKLVYYSDLIVPENKMKNFEELLNKCEKRYNELPRQEIGYNGGYVKILCDKESTNAFVTCFSGLFRKFKNNFYNPSKIPQFDI
jgi:hypothetical protein